MNFQAKKQNSGLWALAGQSYEDKIKHLENINDPTTHHDDVMRKSKVALLATLPITAIITGLGYYFFFEMFGFWPAILMGITCAALIEFGKYWGGIRFFRLFFKPEGEMPAENTPVNVQFWMLAALFVVTLFLSVRNSTVGLRHAVALFSHQKHYMPFQPATADLDAQIQAKRGDLEVYKNTRWKGTTTVYAQKNIREAEKNLSSLLEAREKTIETQRADYEQERARQEKNTGFSQQTGWIAGGFIELIQIVLLLLCVSSERAFYEHVKRNQNPGSAQKPYFYQSPAPHFNVNSNTNHSDYGAQFRWNGYGQRADNPTTHASGVTHPSPGVTHHTDSDDILRLSKKDFSSWMANFASRKHDNETVHRHCQRICDALLDKMRSNDFAPTYTIAVNAFDYFSNKFDEMERMGWGYSNKESFLEVLKAAVPEPA